MNKRQIQQYSALKQLAKSLNSSAPTSVRSGMKRFTKAVQQTEILDPHAALWGTQDLHLTANNSHVETASSKLILELMARNNITQWQSPSL